MGVNRVIIHRKVRGALRNYRAMPDNSVDFAETLFRQNLKTPKKERKVEAPPIDPAIIKAIERAQCDVIIKNLETVHPNMDLIQKMIKITENYIKEHKRIVYGGTAIEAYLEAKGVQIQHDPRIIGEADNSLIEQLRCSIKYLDYDFYTPNNERDSIAIANLFQEAGFKYSRRVLAIHHGTYRVSAEFTREFIADATFVPEKVYKDLPKCEINGIYYIDPQFLKIDLYTSVSNPHTNVFRWEKSYKRLIQLEALYPLPSTEPPTVPDKDLPTTDEALVLEKYSKNNKDIIIVGTQGYNLYIKTVKMPIQPIVQYAFYALDPITEAKKVQKKLKKGYSITNHQPYLDIFSKHTELKDKKGKIIAEWYDIGSDCIAITEIDRHYVANYHWELRFLYGKYSISRLNNSEFDKYYSYLIQSLMKAYNTYHENKILHRRDVNNPFKIFQTDCIKHDIPPVIGKKRVVNWSYKPDKEKKDPNTVETKYEDDMLGEEI